MGRLHDHILRRQHREADKIILSDLLGRCREVRQRPLICDAEFQLSRRMFSRESDRALHPEEQIETADDFLQSFYVQIILFPGHHTGL